jgi:hypothetical protein
MLAKKQQASDTMSSHCWSSIVTLCPRPLETAVAAAPATPAASSRTPRHALEQEIAANALLRDDATAALVRAPTLIVRAELCTLGPTAGLILPPEEA